MGVVLGNRLKITNSFRIISFRGTYLTMHLLKVSHISSIL